MHISRSVKKSLPIGHHTKIIAARQQSNDGGRVILREEYLTGSERERERVIRKQTSNKIRSRFSLAGGVEKNEDLIRCESYGLITALTRRLAHRR